MTRSGGPGSAAADGWRFPNPATPPGSADYYSIRFSAAGRRDALAALFALRRELRHILVQVSDPGVARRKLDWWRDEIGRGLEGRAQHPLCRPLEPAQRSHALPLDPFLDMARRVEDELQGSRSTTRAAHWHRLGDDRGALFQLICHCHWDPCNRLTDDATLAGARDAGAWCTQVRQLRAVGRLLRQGREIAPQDLLEQIGLSQSELVRTAMAQSAQAGTGGPHPDPSRRARLCGLLAELAPAPFPAAAAAALPLPIRIQLRIHAALLQELVRADFDLLDRRIGLTPLRKLWIAWRTSRG
ncbi:hypothetical protein F2Q65_00230 [Thiohalocapsa marina]|uniref:Squalene/phytoene synthase family protein n=1 Tax=Thiohalocapsa marina TaxID=424902 RepID=A0A5M8FV56_9GAMM|nr:squalene/phytoene synthase family protein [Thiohalocapsa marina]KAA6187708.1 hypothetical protein F2Q65_00230 [Thiohalocapsa marina]